ncbi:MAG: hypothetical protein IKN57_10530 [Parasporobacterium sp.]|nr:hypothetical protein [Parasporobacterium sp.]
MEPEKKANHMYCSDNTYNIYKRTRSRRITVRLLFLFIFLFHILLSGCGETSDVDASAVALLWEMETENVQEAVMAVNQAEASRAQAVADSVAASVGEEQRIASEKSSEMEAAAYSASAAAHENRLAELCAGTNLVPGEVREIDDNALPVIHLLFKSILLVGDSRVEAAKMLGVVTEDEVVYLRGGSAEIMAETFERAAYLYPKKVMFYLGLNDTIMYEGDAEKFIRDYHQRITEFQAIDPDCTIYVHCVPPVGPESLERDQFTAYCGVFNEAVFRMCQEYGYIYIDGTKYMYDNCYYEDGQHFTRKFYTYWVQDMANQLGLWDDIKP